MIFYNSFYNFEVFLLRDFFKLCYLRIVIIKYVFFIVIYDVDYSSRLGMSCLVNMVFCREFYEDNDIFFFLENEGFWKCSKGFLRI